MKELIKRFFKEEEGTELVEWAAVLGIIIVGAIALLGPIGEWGTAAWTYIAGVFAAAPVPGA